MTDPVRILYRPAGRRSSLSSSSPAIAFPQPIFYLMTNKETSEPPLTDAERELLDHRLREYEADRSAARPWAEVRAEILERR